jgi:hypothetical protein
MRKIQSFFLFLILTLNLIMIFNYSTTVEGAYADNVFSEDFIPSDSYDHLSRDINLTHGDFIWANFHSNTAAHRYYDYDLAYGVSGFSGFWQINYGTAGTYNSTCNINDALNSSYVNLTLIYNYIPDAGEYIEYTFYDKNSIPICRYKFDSNSYDAYEPDDTPIHSIARTDKSNFKIEVGYSPLNSSYYIRSIKTLSNGVPDYEIQEDWFTTTANDYIDYFNMSSNEIGGTGIHCTMWLTNIEVGAIYDPGGYEAGDINLKVYDSVTGQQVYCFGHDTISNVDDDFIYTEIHSDLWAGDYDPTQQWGLIISLDVNIPSTGEYHFINLTFIVGQIDGVIRYFYNITNYLQLFPGQTYSIYISDVIQYGGYDNCKQNDYEFGDSGFAQICTDKDQYTQGESINLRYVAPDPIYLHEHHMPTGAYFIWIYDVENLGWLWWETDGGQSADNYAYLSDWAVSLDNHYHYLHWDYDPGETYGYKTVTGGLDHYKCFMGHSGGGLFGVDLHLVSGPEFYVIGGDFRPMGNFTSISPSEPKLGQMVNISFNANNNGYITVRNVLDPSGNEIRLTEFQRFEGIEHVNRQFFDFGSYELKLYVNGGVEFTVVDTYNFDITDINGSYGDFGFGIEFLTVEPSRVIAGFDVVYINYRSLDDTGTITVIDARGQTTSYGTVVGTGKGVLNITLPNYAAIGEWNVSLVTENNTLYSSFNVIAEENNWVEFAQNVYYEGGQFNVKLKHDKKVELVFLKDGQEIGTNWYLDVGILPSGIYDVPMDKVIPTPGSWTVELWQVNNFVKIKKLASDTCIVEEESKNPITEGGYDDIFSILAQGAGSIAGGEFGYAFMAIIIILVVIVSLAQMKLKNDTIFFIGIITALFMVYIGWLPLWIVVVSIVLAGLLFSSAFSKKLGIGS